MDSEEKSPADLLFQLLQNPPPNVDLTIVGGSALVFWASLYIETYPQYFDTQKIVGTKDIDFIALLSAARACHQHWGGELHEPGFGHATPELAILCLNKDENPIEIDFLPDLVKIPKHRALKDREPVVGISDSDGFYVLSEFMVLLNRVNNTIYLSRYQNEHAYDQLHNAISVVKSAIQARLDTGEYNRAARLAYNLLDLARNKALGIKLCVDFEIDVLDGLIFDDRYPKEFNEIALPALNREIQERREARARHLELRRKEQEQKLAK